MRECCRKIQAERVINSRNKIHQTWGPLFSPPLYKKKFMKTLSLFHVRNSCNHSLFQLKFPGFDARQSEEVLAVVRGRFHVHVPPSPSSPASDWRRSTKRTRFREEVRQVSAEEGRRLHVAPLGPETSRLSGKYTCEMLSG